jgi:hypothetical protein
MLEAILGSFELDRRFINLESSNKDTPTASKHYLRSKILDSSISQKVLLKSPRSFKIASKMSMMPDSLDQET